MKKNHLGFFFSQNINDFSSRNGQDMQIYEDWMSIQDQREFTQFSDGFCKKEKKNQF